MNRYKSLAAQDAIAQQTYDDSVTAYERAKSTYERAAADLSDATITAPMSGTVVGTPLKAGQTISTGIPHNDHCYHADLKKFRDLSYCRRN